jgi:hypothetical protein
MFPDGAPTSTNTNGDRHWFYTRCFRTDSQSDIAIDLENTITVKTNHFLVPGLQAGRFGGRIAMTRPRDAIGDLGHGHDAQVAALAVASQPFRDSPVRPRLLGAQMRNDAGIEQVHGRGSLEQSLTHGPSRTTRRHVLRPQKTIGKQVAKRAPWCHAAVPLLLGYQDDGLLAVPGNALGPFMQGAIDHVPKVVAGFLQWPGAHKVPNPSEPYKIRRRLQ